MEPHIKIYPKEELAHQLTVWGIPTGNQDLAAMKKILVQHFAADSVKHLHDANETAEILIYLAKKRLIDLNR
jgi:hypothetical protein